MKLPYPPGATPLDPNELDGLLPTSVGTVAELNEFEQANILDAQQWAFGRKHRSVASEKFLKTLHRRMFDQVWRWAGTYRRSNKNIGVDWMVIGVEVHKLCADLEHWIANRVYPWDELGARFHHRLVSIHPFANGNGRHARLATDVLMKAHGQTLFSWGAEQHLAKAGETRSRYIAALRAADQRDYDPLIRFVRS